MWNQVEIQEQQERNCTLVCFWVHTGQTINDQDTTHILITTATGHVKQCMLPSKSLKSAAVTSVFVPLKNLLSANENKFHYLLCTMGYA